MWVWSDAPGSPRASRIRAHLVGHPDPELDQVAGDPFTAGPDCRRFVFDERGFPVRTRPALEGEAPRDAYAWTYDARGRVIEERVDSRPFCDIDDFGDQGPCGEPDGQWDQVIHFTWRDSGDGGSIVRFESGEERSFDANGHLIRATDARGDVIVESSYVDGQRMLSRTPDQSSTFRYDGPRLTEMRMHLTSGAERLVLWDYDERGNLRGELIDGVPHVTITNTYRDGRLVAIEREYGPNTTGGPFELERRHDGNGLLVGESITEDHTRLIRDRRRVRDADGVPLEVSGGPDEDYRCLASLAPRFIQR